LGLRESGLGTFRQIFPPERFRDRDFRARTAPMPRFALKVEYHGAPFAGWQRQADQPSVQGAIEAALAKLEPGPHTIAAAGRTDAGVHALAQVAHCDLQKEWDPFRLSEALNFHLKPQPVAIVAAARVDDDWHARFSAVERQYTFRLLMRRAPATHDAGLVWQISHDLALEPMQEAAQHLIGRHDFTTFRSSICQAASPVKTLDELTITRENGWSGPEIRFFLRARSFLHNQVRSFVGTLERVGAGSWQPGQVRDALQACDRAACGPVCPPQGLYLSGVGYPDDPFA
jgi:tRNA pseudouridine38-40 synthase